MQHVKLDFIYLKPVDELVIFDK